MAKGARRKTVLVGVTGSIAAYKACELVRLLVKDGYVVVPLLTPEAERFVSVHTFEALARRESPRDLYPHLGEADLLVVAPLSANTLAKLAHGFADTVLAQAALAFRGPVLVAPAMNRRMWEHPATQANARLLRERGVQILGPATGELAEGEVGAGRMAEPEAIAARCRILLDPPADGPLAGKRVLVSAGGTREPLDAVRYVANRSSGKMGVALAAEAARRGAEVTLLYANGAVPPPVGIEVVETPTAAELAREALARAREADVVLMAAAVADYRPREPITGKRGKNAEAWTVTLEPTEDVLARLGAERRDGQVIVGFAADVGEQGLARAREKLRRKRGTLLVFNDVSRADIGFAADENEVVLVSERGERTIGKRSKDEVAAAILDEVATQLGES
ncbi:MAG: bifunctional phosphopantothenoylcysteine decarboxylase/phosphopantothenate--cysteine ligase CoaBC [Thermoleophilia bacterium]|nr:bifunctional phosphopantothenoylcysteine decarboxylase/phosphopantothenate--cysteine ligase CoaBC [Thermoleophilia bacterium]